MALYSLLVSLAMKLPAIIFLFAAQITFGQTARDWLMASHMDLVKSDNDGYFEKVQISAEVNYFLSKEFTATAGVEYWTRGGFSAVVGTRWYPIKDAFLRLRGLGGGVNRLSIGGGFAKPMTEKLRFEALTDFYFGGDFTIRAGFAYMFRTTPVDYRIRRGSPEK